MKLLPTTKEEVKSIAGVCLSVCLSCLLARLLKNACIDLDEILRVDRCLDMDELFNFWARSGSKSGFRNRIPFSDIVYATELCSLAYSLAYFSAISVSICAKLARSILMRDRNTAAEPHFRQSLSKCRILSPKNSWRFRTSIAAKHCC